MEAKDSFFVMWFEEHIRPLLKTHLLNNNFRPIKVHLTVGGTQESPPLQRSKFAKKEKGKVLPSHPADPRQARSDNDLREFCCLRKQPNRLSPFLRTHRLRQHPPKIRRSYNCVSNLQSNLSLGRCGVRKTHLLMALTYAFKRMGLNALYKSQKFFDRVTATSSEPDKQKKYLL